MIAHRMVDLAGEFRLGLAIQLEKQFCPADVLFADIEDLVAAGDTEFGVGLVDLVETFGAAGCCSQLRLKMSVIEKYEIEISCGIGFRQKSQSLISGKRRCRKFCSGSERKSQPGLQKSSSEHATASRVSGFEERAMCRHAKGGSKWSVFKIDSKSDASSRHKTGSKIVQKKMQRRGGGAVADLFNGTFIVVSYPRSKRLTESLILELLDRTQGGVYLLW
jgi:hypothetical protein